MLTRKRVILAKIELSEGVKETLSATDNPILVKDLRVAPKLNMYERNVVLPYLSKLPAITGGQAATVSFSAEVKGAGSAYGSSVYPAIKDYLKACGFNGTLTPTQGAEKWTFTPISNNIPSLTIGIYEDGTVHYLTGARGTVSFSGAVGEPVIANFEFQGVWYGFSDTTLPTPTIDIENPPVCLETIVTLNTSFSPIINKFTLDIANSVELRSDISSEKGFKTAMITDRNPKGTIDPEAVKVSTFDFYGKYKNGDSIALDIEVGETKYNRVKFQAPYIRITDISEDDRNGIMVFTVNFAMTTSAGDDEFVIVFD